jgi:alpha-amylase/alpha-mannosidase (GH57 family)
MGRMVGEHQHKSTGIFQFLQRLPERILKHNKHRLRWPSEAAACSIVLKKNGDEKLIQVARKLSSSDHFYYMYTEGPESDLTVHRYFLLYSSPEDAYICYVNALASLEEKISS